MALIQDNAVSTEEEALTFMLHEILTDSETDVGQFCFKEETIEKLMQELYKEITTITVSAPSPEPPSPTTPTLSSNVSVGGQVEPEDEIVEFEVAQKTEEEEFKDFDDEWLARVLSWSQVLDTADWF
ncbi:hypothetical protein DEO72_LG11g3414 [Vigna unguiculata]|uniref:Uncharacterized protein n=1 Tax=Vigna unguiculata TaxID=3917 RepID=A0A4D6NR63_VIGUN|nr:hypothetical protein DEO72_LG11g3414 [Vigna unguiculata]